MFLSSQSFSPPFHSPLLICTHHPFFILPSGGFDKEHGWPVGRVQGPPHGVRRGVRTGKYVSHLFLGIWPILIVFFPILTVILEDEFAGSSLIRVVLR